MSKTQLLYIKMVRITFIFSGLFFALFVVDLFFAIATNALVGIAIKEDAMFFRLTVYPFLIMSVVFLIIGRFIHSLANKESELLSVYDYRKAIEDQDKVELQESISREDLYERLKKEKREETANVFYKIGLYFRDLFKDSKEKLSESSKHRNEKREEKQHEKELRRQQEEEAMRLEDAKRIEEEAKRARTKLNKTALVLLISDVTHITQNEARKFLNTFLDTVKETVSTGEEVRIADFGKFVKIHVDKHIDKDEITQKEVLVEDHNTVDFVAFKKFVGRFEENEDIMDSIEDEAPEEEKDVQPESTIESKPEPAPTPEPVAETKPEPVVEVKPEPVAETKPEPVVETKPKPVVETKPKPVVETKPEPVAEAKPEPVVEAKPEPVVEAKPEPVVETKPEPVVETKPEPVAETKPTPTPVVVPVVEAKPKVVKPPKPVVSTRTKKDIIEMLDATTSLSKNKANKFLKFFAEVVKEQLAERNDIELPGIGFFTTIEMPAKVAVNPQTNQKIIVPAHHQVRLRFDEDLKDKMNEEK